MHSSSLKFGKIREKFKYRDTSLYLIVGMICVLAYSIILPLFIAPDDFYHFDCSGYISNTVIDRSYISKSNWEYPDYVKQSIKEKTYIRNLFFTKIKTINRKDVFDKRAKFQKNYEFWGHVIPAIGMKLGFLIYPSIGVMIVFSRIFSGIFYLICLYFIIRKLQYGKKLFMAVSLTPTMLPLLSSMNYDGLNFVITSLFIMMIINISVKDQYFLSDIIPILISAILVFFCAKTNMILLLLFLLIPLCKFFVNSFLKRILSIQSLYLSIFIILVTVSVFYALTIKLVARSTIIKIINTIFYPSNMALSSEILGGNLTFNSSILNCCWTIIIVFLLTTNEDEVRFKTKEWAWTAIFLYFLNIIILLVSYQNFPDSVLLSKKIIGGVQGRYITPYILPLTMITVSFNKGVYIDDKIKKILILGSAIISTVIIIYISYVFN